VGNQVAARQAPRIVAPHRRRATVQVEPACAEARRAVRVAVHVAYPVPGHGLRVSAERPWLGGPALCLDAGLGPVAREALRRAGPRLARRTTKGQRGSRLERGLP
jgi:hypothetical protein